MIARQIRWWIICCLITITSALLAKISVDSAFIQCLRVLYSLPPLFFLTGYGITNTVFGPNALDNLQKTVFSIGISLVSLVVLGLILNFRVEGLSTNAWLISVLSLSLFTNTTALWHIIPELKIKKSPNVLDFQRTVNFKQIGLLFIAMIIFLAAILVSRTSEEAANIPSFTQFWMVSNSKTTAEIGIKNMESKSVDYRVTISWGQTVIDEHSPIRLDNNQQWTIQITLPIDLQQGVIADLYRLDNPDQIYREVVLRSVAT